MRKLITHFMWRYQESFRFSLKYGVEHLFGVLSFESQPEAFLIGVRMEHDHHRPAACVEPELNHWAKSEHFYTVLDDIDSIRESYPESQLFHTHPIAQQNEDKRLFRRALRDAILQRLEKCPDRPSGLIAFASQPVEREGFLVVIILMLQESVLHSIPAVKDGTINVHEYRSFRVPKSIVEAAIEELFITAGERMIQPDAGAGFGVLGSVDDILRKSAGRFFSGLLNRIDEDSLGNADAIYDQITRIALTAYERVESHGTLVFTGAENSSLTTVVKLARPVRLESTRAARKLLEIATDGYVLHCFGGDIQALSEAPTGSVELKNRCCRVEIIGRAKWRVAMDGRELMVVADGLPSLPRPAVDEPSLERNLRRIIPGMSAQHAAMFANIGLRLASSDHGALLVIATNAADEAKRLSGDGLPVVQVALTAELALNLTRIDGALICSENGSCHAIGVILDGGTVPDGDSSRGSRFNSALRYVRANSEPCAAIIVSEDGGLDLVPKLKPVLSRKLILEHIEEMKRLTHAPSVPPHHEREGSLSNWFREHSFYLSQTQCDEINECITICSERIESSVKFSHPTLKPDSAFRAGRDLID